METGLELMELTEGKILRELAAIGFARAEDYLELVDGVPRLKAVDSMAAVAAVETTSKGVKLRFYDKLRALELLGKHLGLFGGGGFVPEDNNLLEALMDAAGEEVSLFDLQELQQATEDRYDLVGEAGAEEL